MTGTKEGQQKNVRLRRYTKPKSFIFVLDNLLKDEEIGVLVKGQRMRTQRKLEELFGLAGLVTHKKTGREPMPEPNRDVMLWALY